MEGLISQSILVETGVLVEYSTKYSFIVKSGTMRDRDLVLGLI